MRAGAIVTQFSEQTLRQRNEKKKKKLFVETGRDVSVRAVRILVSVGVPGESYKTFRLDVRDLNLEDFCQISPQSRPRDENNVRVVCLAIRSIFENRKLSFTVLTRDDIVRKFVIARS